MIKKNILSLIILTVIMGCTSAPKPFTGGELHGMVYDKDNRPCKNVTIIVDDWHRTQTDINGRFMFPSISKGEHVITTVSDKHEPVSMTVHFAKETEIIYIKLTSSEQLLRMIKEELTNNDLHSAKHYLARFQEIESDNPRGIFLEAVIAYREKDYLRCEALLISLVEKGFKEPAILLFQADLYQYKLENNELAILKLEEYIDVSYSEDAYQRLQKLIGETND